MENMREILMIDDKFSKWQPVLEKSATHYVFIITNTTSVEEGLGKLLNYPGNIQAVMLALSFANGAIQGKEGLLNIKDPSILEFVDSEIDNNKLWPEPLVQFNPTFEKGRSLSELVKEGHLHSEIDKIFTGFSLFRHQEEAILLGAKGKEFVVTSGTGSGKSLTYMATIFDHVLKQGDLATNKIQAVVVYPMNALINSQFKEIEKFKTSYEEKYHKSFPITFGQYTGQEDEEKREALRTNPPHIILTNYMMLELIMTRGGKDIDA